MNMSSYSMLKMPRKQRGATLIIALVFLTALTLIGATAAQNSSLEERMSSNARNRDLALQAAESALKYVQLNLASISGMNFTGSVAGLTMYDSTRADDAMYWGTTFVWSNTTALRLANTDSGLEDRVASLPQYVVEKMPNIGTIEYYRVTARGVGGDANAVVILQAAYSYPP